MSTTSINRDLRARTDNEHPRRWERLPLVKRLPILN